MNPPADKAQFSQLAMRVLYSPNEYPLTRAEITTLLQIAGRATLRAATLTRSLEAIAHAKTPLPPAQAQDIAKRALKE